MQVLARTGPELKHHPGSKPTIKQKLAAVRMLYDFLVVRQITPSNPAHSVRGPKYVVKKGKTPVWSREDAKTLLESIPKDSVSGLRDHVSVVVDDLAPAIAFFTTLGMTLEGEMPVEGPWVDRVNGLQSVQVDIVMMRTPDGHGRLELTKFRNPKPIEIEPAIAPPNTLGLRSVMFTVESVDDTVARRAPTAPNSSERWPSTRTSTDSATCEALRASSSRWPRNSSEAFTPSE
jgi:catechol 2,3-dioxygenase-like lactoylglutathione lyase family enzyme